MLGLTSSFAVVCLLIFMLYKKVNAHATLLISGLTLLICAKIFGIGEIIDAKHSLNFAFFDLFEVLNTNMSKTLSGLGLTLMCIAGFSAYMDHVGASYALFKVFEKPLRIVKNPYLLLTISYFVVQFLVIFIPSHAGLALLLMVTIYPILVRSGVSKLSALSVIAICQYIDHGPGSGNVIMASKTAMIDPAVYFVEHQLPITIPIIIAVAIVNYFVQKYFDKKEGFIFDKVAIEKELNEAEGGVTKKPPMIYAILPIVPLILILGFSQIFHSPIKMNVPVAMIISTMIAICFEMYRYRNVVETINSIMIFFKGMGHLFVITVSLIVCGQVFAAGLISVGFVDTLVSIAKNAGFGVFAIIVFVSLIVSISAFFMGSGNAAFFSFAPLIPKIAKSFGIDTITMILPVQIMAGFGRCMSPIAPAILAISTMTKVSPLQVVKRTAIPMVSAGIVNLAMTYFYL